MRHLRLASALLSLAVAAYFVVWLMCWPAPSRRTISYTGNMIYYTDHPEAIPTRPYYGFQMKSETIDFEMIIGVALVWPVTLFGWWLVQGAVAEATERRTAAARQAQRCASCGYDLRATPDRCPECGRAVAKPSGSVTGMP